MKVLYLGSMDGTSLHRANAFRRLGHEIVHIDPSRFVDNRHGRGRLHYETGSLFAARSVERGLLAALPPEKLDFVWVDGGRQIGPRVIETLRSRFGPVVNFNHDDPYGRRDRFAWLLFRRAVAAYDLVAVVREENVAEAKALGARRVERIYRTADEVAHRPRTLDVADHAKWDSDVVFVGTGLERGRAEFLGELVSLGVPLSIWGNKWQNSPQWPTLGPYWRGPGTTNDDDYAKAILASKVALGLTSKENRDLHTTRSLEIPYLGGLFCAERTTEHLELYVEGKEAMFWSSASECAEVIHNLLGDSEMRQSVAHAGRERALANGHTSEKMIAHLLSLALEGNP